MRLRTNSTEKAATGRLPSKRPIQALLAVGDQFLLVAREDIVPYWRVAADAHAPLLFGHDFHHNDALGLWYLHAWIWRQNPLGMFADYNPKVALCPGPYTSCKTREANLR